MSVYDNAMLAVKTTAPKYLKDASDQTIRRRIVLSTLQQSGNIIFGVRSPSMTWQVEVREPKVRSMVHGQRSVFKMHDAYESLTIDHAEIEATDRLDRRTQMINDASPQQIIDLASTKMEKLVRKLSRTIGDEFFTDSSGTGSSQLTGLQSFCKAGTTASTDLVAQPDSTVTYGGKSIGLGQSGGFWSSDLAVKPNAALAKDWPEGSGSSEYDWNSPKIFQASGAWTSGTNNWEANCTRILRRGASAISNLGGENVAPMIHILSVSMYNQFMDNLETRERLNVSDYAKELGFPGVMNYEGALVVQDFACPANRGYGINPNEMCLYSVHDQLFFTDGPSWEIPEQSTLFLVGFLGNYRWNVKNVVEYRA